VRIVLDTNVLVAAHATHGLCLELLSEVLEHHELVLSREMLAELERVMQEKLGLTPGAARLSIVMMAVDVDQVQPDTIPASECRDPDDCVVLGTAVAGRADLIVSGDQDLLVLGSFRGIRVISPRACFQHLRDVVDGGAGLVAERRPRWRRSRKKG
jgi:putative PIN family toxin of toxin-antitoxin system